MNGRKPKQDSEKEKNFIKQELLNLLKIYQKHESELGNEKVPEKLKKAKTKFEAKVQSLGIRQREPDEDFALYVKRVAWEEAGMPTTRLLPLTENEKPRLDELLCLLERKVSPSPGQNILEFFRKAYTEFFDNCSLEREKTEIPERPLDLISLGENQVFKDVKLLHKAQANEKQDESENQIKYIRQCFQNKELAGLVEWWDSADYPDPDECMERVDRLTKKCKKDILFCIVHAVKLRHIRQFFDDYEALGFKRPPNNDLLGNYKSIAANLGLSQDKALKGDYSLNDLEQLLEAKRNEKTSEKKSDKKRKSQLPRQVLDRLAAEYLAKKPDATIRKVAKEIGCPIGTVCKLKSWRIVMDERNKENPTTPKCVAFTDEMEETIGEGERDEELKRLLKEQETDRRETGHGYENENEAPPHKFSPRRKP